MMPPASIAPLRSVRSGDYRGQALFFVNEEPFFLMEAGILHAVERDDGAERIVGEVLRRAKLLGLNAVEIGIDWSYLSDEHVYDPLFERIDGLIGRITSTGLYATLRVRAEYKPSWYSASLITDLRGTTDENFVSFHGDDFLLRAARFLRNITANYANHPFVLQMLIGFGCEAMNRYPGNHLEWTDYSDEGKAAFIRNLRERYDDSLEALNKEWGSHYTSFDRICPPTQEVDNSLKPSVIDFKRFRMKTLQEISKGLLNAVRSEVDSRPIGTFIEGGASYPSNKRGSNPPAWANDIDFSKIPNNYFEEAESIRAVRHTTSSFLKQVVLVNELTTGPDNTPAGATYALLETLEQPSYPSFIFLQSMNSDCLEKLSSAIEFVKRNLPYFWGRDAEVGLLDNTRGANIGALSDNSLYREHEFLARSLLERGVCFDAIYPENIYEALCSGQYKFLLVSPVHLLPWSVLEQIRNSGSKTKIVFCIRGDKTPSILLKEDRLKEVFATDIEKILNLPSQEFAHIPAHFENDDLAMVRGCFVDNPEWLSILDALLEVGGVRAVLGQGIEGTFVHENFFVGRVYSSDTALMSITVKNAIPPDECVVLDSTDLTWRSFFLQWRLDYGNCWSARFPEPVNQHDLIILFTTT